MTFSDFVDETWTLRVYKSDKDVVTESADGWVNVAWLYGAGVADTECGFDIREDGSEDWTRVDQKYVTMDGGKFTARVPHLKANTTYECRAYSGDQVGDVVTFSTTETGSVPNMGFEDCLTESRNTYLPDMLPGSMTVLLNTREPAATIAPSPTTAWSRMVEPIPTKA